MTDKYSKEHIQCTDGESISYHGPTQIQGHLSTEHFNNNLKALFCTTWSLRVFDSDMFAIAGKQYCATDKTSARMTTLQTS